MSQSAGAAVAASPVPLSRRLALLTNVPAFVSIADHVLSELAAGLQEERYDAGSVVVSEGEAGDRLYLLVEGRTEVSTATPAGPAILATLEAGEVFGELALVSPSHQRQATVTAITPLLTLCLSTEAFESLIRKHPEVRESIAATAEGMQVAKFLKQASPFAALDPATLRELAGRLERLSASPGTTIVRQGEPGNACYLLRSGSVEVVVQSGDAAERRLATLRSGTLFGEAALLTEAPRNASVRALEPCELLVLRRADLVEAMRANHSIGRQMLELLQLRDRPRRVEGVIVRQQVTADGVTITVLKNPYRGAYYRLSSEGWFLWERLDGQHTLRDLALDYLGAFKSFAPQAIIEVMAGLAAAGFLDVRSLRPDVLSVAAGMTRWQQAVLLGRRMLSWQVAFRNVDPLLTAAYRFAVRHLYTLPGQLAMAALSLAGLLTFILGGDRMQDAIHSTSGGALVLFLVLAYLLSIVCHEAGHAFTTKAFGREVSRLGVGWYLFGPVAFVDTTDMWLSDRWPRIAVSVAGPYANFVLAGFASLATWLTPDPALASALAQFALISYLMVLVNLIPLLDYDGYFVLMDLFERPNLRARALSWLRRDFLPTLRKREGLRGHWLDLLFVLGSLLYTVALAVLALAFYRLIGEGS